MNANWRTAVICFLVVAFGPLDPIAVGKDWHVYKTESHGNGSLPFAVSKAEDGDRIVFDTDVSGKTITLTDDLEVTQAISFYKDGNDNVTVDVTDESLTFGTKTCSIGNNITFQAVKLTPEPGVIGVACILGDDIHLNNCSGSIYTSTLGLSFGFWGGNVTIDNMDGALSSYSSSGFAFPFYANSVQINNCSGTILADSHSNYGCGAYTEGDIIIGNLSGSVTTSGGAGAFGFYSETGLVHLTNTFSGTVTATSADVANGIYTSGNVTIDNMTDTALIEAQGGSEAYGIKADDAASIVTITNCSGRIIANATTGPAGGIYSLGTVNVGTLAGSISAKTDGEDSAYGIYTNGAIEIGDITSSGRITADATSGTSGSATGIYNTNEVIVANSFAGAISANATGQAVGIDAGSVQLGNCSGSISATSTSGLACSVYGADGVTITNLSNSLYAKGSTSSYGLLTQGNVLLNNTCSGHITAISETASALGIDTSCDVTIDNFTGSITANGVSQSYGIRSYGTVNLLGNSTGSVTTTTTEGCPLGILGVGGVTIENFSNPGAIITQGYGDAYGIAPFNGDLLLSGNCSGTVTTTSYANDAFSIYCPTYSTVTIENFSGTIEATGAGSAAAIVTQTGGVVSLSGTCTGNINATGGSGYAVGICSGGDVSMSDFHGKINAHGVTEAYGIQTDGSVLTNDFHGTIAATATAGPACGIYAANGMNSGVLNSAGTSTAAVITGSISATGTSAYAIMGKGINIIVADSATLSAVKTASDGDACAIESIGDSNNHVKLISGCHITGDICLNSAAADALTLDGSTGSTTLAGEIEANTIDVIGGNWTISGVIDENATLLVEGGTLTFTGNTPLKSNLSVQNGAMSFNGITTGTATVCDCGLLCGNGTVGQLINHGVVSPGNSIGTLSVIGDYTHAPGSALDIEINNAGQCDKLDIGGKAAIEGGTLLVDAQSGKYKLGSTYTFLTADGGVSGTFDTILDNLPFLDMAVIYGAYDIQLLLEPGGSYDSEAVTFNQHGVARYLDAQKAGATGDFAVVLDELNVLDAEDARLAFDAMSGDLYGSLSTISIENHEQFLRTIAQRLQYQSIMRGFDLTDAKAQLCNNVTYVNRKICGRQSCWTPWAQGYGIGASLAGNGNAGGLGYSTGGVAVGMERLLDDNTRCGIAGGYSSTYINLDNHTESSSIDGGQAALYLHRSMGCAYLTGIAGYGYNSYDAERVIEFGILDRTANANYGGNNFSFYTEIGRTLQGDRIHLQPYGALEYIQVHQNDFIESGADSIDLSVGGIQSDAFRSLLGSRLLSNYCTNAGRLISLEGRAAWRHEFLDENRILDASFAGQTGGNFAIAGVNVDRDNAILGTGLTCNFCKNFSVFANYDVVTSTNYTAHAGSGGLQYVW